MLFHITIATRGRATLFPSEAALLDAVRAVARSPELILFSFVDDHAHFVVSGDGSTRARAIAHSLHRSDVTPLQRADVKPVDGRTHLTTLVRYLAAQPAKHGLGVHGALWTGSCAPDLLGVRRLPGFDPGRIEFQLPRASVRDLVIDAVGVWRPALSLATQLPDPLALWDLAHAAAAAHPADHDANAIAARVAWAHLCSGVDDTPPDLVPARTLRWLRARTPDPALIEILRRRASLTAWVGTLSSARPASGAGLPRAHGWDRLRTTAAGSP